jgi:TRAP-type transport system periplasmic protein
MKIRIVLTVAVVALAFALLAGIYPNEATAQDKGPVKKITLKNTNWEAPTTFNNVHMWVWWAQRADQLLKRAGYGDQYEIVSFTGGQLASGPDTYEAIRDGIADCGWVPATYEGVMPLVTVADLPFLYKDHLTHLKLWRRLYNAGMQDYMHSVGIHIAGPAGFMTPYGLWSRKPVGTLEELKGQKIRNPGGVNTDILKALGMIPVQMASPESYSSMQTGVLDGVNMTEVTNVSLKLEELTRHVSRFYMNVPSSASGVAWNPKTWNALPRPVQVIMEQATIEACYHHWEAYHYTADQEVTKTLNKRGIKIATMSEKEKARWVERLMPIWDKWLAEHGKKFNGMGEKFWKICKQHYENPHMEETGF